MRAAELLRNKFGVSQLYKHQVEQDDEVVLEIYWHPLTIAERESIKKNADSDEAGDFALGMMIRKALDADGKRLFQDGEKVAVLKNAVEAAVLQDISLRCWRLEQRTRWRKRRQTSKANGDWFFSFCVSQRAGHDRCSAFANVDARRAGWLGCVL